MRLSAGLLAVCLGMSFAACHRPVATFQRSPRETFYAPIQSSTADPQVPADAPGLPAEPLQAPDPVAYADSRTEQVPDSPAQRIRLHQQRTNRLTSPTRSALPETPADPPSTTAPDVVQPGPGPKNKQRKTLRELLGLPPRKKLNWWQRIPWQLKAAVVVTLVAVAFAILHITVLAIVFGIIGAFLLIRGLKKSFKVRRGIFGLGG